MCYPDGESRVEVNDLSKVIDQVNHIWLQSGSITAVCLVSSFAGLPIPVLGHIPNGVIRCTPPGWKLPLWFRSHLVFFTSLSDTCFDPIAATAERCPKAAWNTANSGRGEQHARLPTGLLKINGNTVAFILEACWKPPHLVPLCRLPQARAPAHECLPSLKSSSFPSVDGKSEEWFCAFPKGPWTRSCHQLTYKPNDSHVTSIWPYQQQASPDFSILFLLANGITNVVLTSL